MKYLRRLIWRTEDEMFHPLMHIFLFITLCFGVAFAIAPTFFGATTTVLYTQTVLSGGNSIWGWGLILTTICNTILLATRAKFLGGITAGAGFMLWFYAAITYLMAPYWLGLLVAAVPNMLFWVWYYFRVKSYHRHPPVFVDRESGIIS